MTKLTALVMALLLGAGVLAPLQGTPRTDGGESTIAEIVEVVGTVTEITDEAILFVSSTGEDMQANIGDVTVFEGETPVPGDLIHILYDGTTTRSLPPQLLALKVSCYVCTGVVAERTEDTFMLQCDDGEVIRVNYATQPRGMADGSRVKVYFNGAMTMSLPAQIGAELILMVH